jgi:acetyl-CoA C-acetyltransferase
MSRPVKSSLQAAFVVILSYARTPMGGMQGVADVSATDLGATAVKAAVERAGVDGADIERIYMGCVLPAGLGQAPARQAALKAGLPKSVQATTVNKVCGSGMQTRDHGQPRRSPRIDRLWSSPAAWKA